MKYKHLVFGLLAASLVAGIPAFADSSSFTGTLSSPSDVFTLAFTVDSSGSEGVNIQTWSFGGGTNAHGDVVAPGGFDPFVGVFDGSGSMVTDGSGNPFGTSDLLSNFASFAGCPPAGTVNIGGGSVCGDIAMNLTLAPGSYTLLLSDAGYIPNAVFDNGTLGEGFSDFTGGSLQTCNTTDSGTTCVSDSANWAFDLTTDTSGNGGNGGDGGNGSGSTAMPEPTSSALLGAGGLVVALWRRKFAGK